MWGKPKARLESNYTKGVFKFQDIFFSDGKHYVSTRA
jgi:hypothetical protein